MPTPTQISLDEAAKAAGFSGYQAQSPYCQAIMPFASIRAHAMTLDQLHGRQHPAPVDPVALVLADVLEAWGLDGSAPQRTRLTVFGPDDEDLAAIAVLRTAIDAAVSDALARVVPVDDGVILAKMGPGNFRSYEAEFVSELRNAGFQIIASPAGAA